MSCNTRGSFGFDGFKYLSSTFVPPLRRRRSRRTRARWVAEHLRLNHRIKLSETGIMKRQEPFLRTLTRTSTRSGRISAPSLPSYPQKHSVMPSTPPLTPAVEVIDEPTGVYMCESLSLTKLATPLHHLGPILAGLEAAAVFIEAAAPTVTDLDAASACIQAAAAEQYM